MTKHTIYSDDETGFFVTAWPVSDGSWRVRFQRSGNGVRCHDKTAAWLASNCWDQRRWNPAGARLNPRTRMALVVIEAWLKDQTSAKCAEPKHEDPND